jgi:hypothetical protein
MLSPVHHNLLYFSIEMYEKMKGSNIGKEGKTKGKNQNSEIKIVSLP